MDPKDTIFLEGLKVRCIIGIFEWERRRKQDVHLDLRFPCDVVRAASRDRIDDAVDYKRIAKAAIAFVEKSRFQLVETLTERLADKLLSDFSLPWLTLRVSKPGAIRGSRTVGVEITRAGGRPPGFPAYFSLGSNLRPSLHLANALRAFRERFGRIEASHIYETSPVGGRKGQPPFWNLVVGVNTGDKPTQLKHWARRLETAEGRERGRNRFADRSLDVDLILWGDRSRTGKPSFPPHPDIRKKAFVLFPLLEIAPRLVLPDQGEPLMEVAQAFRDPSQKIRRLSLSVPSR